MKKLYTTFLTLSIALILTAQDIHYSQFYNAPLVTNPALTGLTKGAYRIGAIYRNQWFSGVNTSFFSSPYQTPSVFVDAPIPIKNSAIGIGGLFLYDKAGAGSLSTFQGLLSLSYIQSMGKNLNHQLSLGLQGGLTQTRFNSTTAQFASQYQGNEFNQNLPTNFTFTPGVNYINLNAGLLYYGKFTKKLSLYLGGSLANSVPQKQNVLNNQTKKELYMKYSVSGGFDIGLGERLHLLPSVLFMQQAKADQLNAGLGFGVDISEKASITLGIYDRSNNLSNKDIWSDAVIAYAGFEYSGFKLGASYDFTTSKWRNAKPAVGALEVSLMYIGKRREGLTESKIMFCPRF